MEEYRNYPGWALETTSVLLLREWERKAKRGHFSLDDTPESEFIGITEADLDPHGNCDEDLQKCFYNWIRS